MQFQFFISFFIYFTLLFVIAISVRKKNATTADLLVGNRSLNFWVIALSAQASDMSSWLFMAFPMSIFLGGMPQMWIAVSLVVGMFCTWQFVSTRLRTITQKLNCYTLSSLFATIYGDPKGLIRITSAAMLLLFTTYYLSSGLISIGFLFGSIFQMDYFTGILIATCVMMAYTFIGGFVSVVWADLFQGIFLLGAIMVIPIIAFFHIDGIMAITTQAQASDIPMNLFSLSKDAGLEDIFYPLFGWGLGYFGMPHIIVKFMGIKNAKDLPKAKYVGIGWQILALISAAAVGFIGIAYFQNGIANPEMVFVEMSKQLLHPIWAGLVLCGLLAATISTMDSQILVCASALANDFYRYFVPSATNRQEVVMFRISVVLTSVIALCIALGQNTTIMETVYYAWAGLGCSFGPLLLTTLYSKKATSAGAIAGILTGGLTAAIWPSLNKLLITAGYIGPIPSMIIGFPLSFLMIFAVSSKTKVEVKS
ncbi:MAG: sodium/proline symporter [Verrucomicrobia bacterium]|nr:sodium/proline symporter [Verrucomicrobiota bacterium]